MAAVHGRGRGRGDIVACLLRKRRQAEKIQFAGDFDPATVGEGLQEYVDDGWDVYVTPCRFDPRRPSGRDTRKARDAVWVPGVWLDVDLKPDDPRALHTPDEVRDALAGLPRPTVSVGTGSGGLHLYWLLEEGLDDRERASRLCAVWPTFASRAASEALGREVRLDPVGDLSRVLKLPGTWRHPKPPVWEPRPVLLGHDDGPRFAVDALEALVPAELRERVAAVGAAVGAEGLNVAADDPRVAAYVRRAVAGEAAALAGWVPGQPPGRNSRLNKAAFSLGTLGAHGLLEADAARGELLAACRANRLAEDDGPGACEATFESGWNAGLASPRRLPDFAVLEEAPEGEAPAAPAATPFPHPGEPTAVARRLAAVWRTHDGVDLVRYWRAGWRRYQDGVWRRADDDELGVRGGVYSELEHAVYLDGNGEPKSWLPTTARVNNVLDPLRSNVLRLSEHVHPPAWLDAAEETGRPGPDDLLVLKNGLLRLRDWELLPHDPRLFATTLMPVEWDPDAGCPAWEAFLESTWPDDPDSAVLLRQWFGYVVSGRTDLHKIALLWGQPRSGKSTIVHALEGLLGRGNHSAPPLRSLQSQFGLQSLVDPDPVFLATVGEARTGGTDGLQQVVERLLTISGGDTVNVDRKYKTAWSGRVRARFMIVSNEMPRLGDASTAIISRLVLLHLPVGWSGREDWALPAKLGAERPGILRWALEGLRDLESSGGVFLEPLSAREAREALQEAASPVTAFLRDRCRLGVELEVGTAELYRAWSAWAAEHGHIPGSASTFGRSLRAASETLSAPVAMRRVAAGRVYAGVALLPVAVPASWP
jgi:putative DNA primase/helicase